MPKLPAATDWIPYHLNAEILQHSFTALCQGNSSPFWMLAVVQWSQNWYITVRRWTSIYFPAPIHRMDVILSTCQRSGQHALKGPGFPMAFHQTSNWFHDLYGPYEMGLRFSIKYTRVYLSVALRSELSQAYWNWRPCDPFRNLKVYPFKDSNVSWEYLSFIRTAPLVVQSVFHEFKFITKQRRRRKRFKYKNLKVQNPTKNILRRKFDSLAET